MAPSVTTLSFRHRRPRSTFSGPRAAVPRLWREVRGHPPLILRSNPARASRSDRPVPSLPSSSSAQRGDVADRRAVFSSGHPHTVTKNQKVSAHYTMPNQSLHYMDGHATSSGENWLQKKLFLINCSSQILTVVNRCLKPFKIPQFPHTILCGINL